MSAWILLLTYPFLALLKEVIILLDVKRIHLIYILSCYYFQYFIKIYFLSSS